LQEDAIQLLYMLDCCKEALLSMETLIRAGMEYAYYYYFPRVCILTFAPIVASAVLMQGDTIGPGFCYKLKAT
jgi:hypothetical protein